MKFSLVSAMLIAACLAFTAVMTAQTPASNPASAHADKEWTMVPGMMHSLKDLIFPAGDIIFIPINMKRGSVAENSAIEYQGFAYFDVKTGKDGTISTFLPVKIGDLKSPKAIADIKVSPDGRHAVITAEGVGQPSRGQYILLLEIGKPTAVIVRNTAADTDSRVAWLGNDAFCISMAEKGKYPKQPDLYDTAGKKTGEMNAGVTVVGVTPDGKSLWANGNPENLQAGSPMGAADMAKFKLLLLDRDAKVLNKFDGTFWGFSPSGQYIGVYAMPANQPAAKEPRVTVTVLSAADGRKVASFTCPKFGEPVLTDAGDVIGIRRNPAKPEAGGPLVRCGADGKEAVLLENVAGFGLQADSLYYVPVPARRAACVLKVVTLSRLYGQPPGK